MSAGRPSLYSEEIAEEVCNLLAGGMTLVDICKRKGMPTRQTINNWEHSKPDFFTKCVRAREAQGDYEHDQMALIEKKVLDGEILPDVARVVLSSKQWRAAKLNRKRYADTKIIAGDADNPVQVETTRKFLLPEGLTEEQLDGIEAMLTHTVLAIEHKADDENS